MNKILALPIGDRLWPNCLNRPIRNAGFVDVKDFANKMNKVIVKHYPRVGERASLSGLANRTRGKQILTPSARPSVSIHSLSSGSDDTPKYSDASCILFFECLWLALCLSLVLLLWFSPVCVIVEFRAPVINPVIMSSHELFAKRARFDKLGEAESSRAALFVSPGASPMSKKVRIDPSGNTLNSDSTNLRITYEYSVDAKPSSFSPMLKDLLLSQSLEGLSPKNLEDIIGDSAGHIFHVCFRSCTFSPFTPMLDFY